MADIFGRNSPEAKAANALLAEYNKNPAVADCFVRAANVVGDIRFPAYSFQVSRSPDAVYLSVVYNEPDVATGNMAVQTGRRWVIETHWNEAQILQTAFKAVLTSLEHRAREHFTYKKLAVLNPHNSLESLCAMGALQAREKAADEDFFAAVASGDNSYG
jgi:hypothetical protein